MKVLFLGDSITEGVPGVSYVSRIKKANPDWNIVNRAKGGDTVYSLYKRVLKMNDISEFDHILLFIGVNDIYGKITKSYKILKTLKRQRWAKNNELFSKQFSDLLNHIIISNKKLIVIPPLLIGEDYRNKWNQELKELVDIVFKITIENKTTYLDLYSKFKLELDGKSISSYLPLKIIELIKDVRELKTTAQTDSRSKSRGLHLTLDGVHINSVGATLISEEIIKSIKSNGGVL